MPMYALSKSPLACSSSAVPRAGYGRRSASRRCDQRTRSSAWRSARRGGRCDPPRGAREGSRTPGRPSGERARASARRGAGAAERRRARERSRAAAALRPRGWAPERSQVSARTGKRSRSDSMSFATAARSRRDLAPILTFSPTVSLEKIRRPSGTSEIPIRSISSGGAAREVGAIEHDPARSRPLDPDDRHQGAGLARPVVADQSDELALVDVERKAVHRPHAAIGDGEILNLQHAAPQPPRRPPRPGTPRSPSGSCGSRQATRPPSSCRSRAPGWSRRP